MSLKDPSTIRHLFLFQPEVGIFCCLYHGLGTREHQVSSSNNKNKFRQMPHDTKRPFPQHNCPSLKSWGENWSAWHEHRPSPTRCCATASLTLFADRLSCERRIILPPLLNWAHKLQSADIWVCWPAKPRYRSFNTNMLTEVYYDWKKLNAPKLDTKTPKKPADGENGECVPQWCHPRGLRIS